MSDSVDLEFEEMVQRVVDKGLVVCVGDYCRLTKEGWDLVRGFLGNLSEDDRGLVELYYLEVINE